MLFAIKIVFCLFNFGLIAFCETFFSPLLFINSNCTQIELFQTIFAMCFLTPRGALICFYFNLCDLFFKIKSTHFN